MRWESHFSNEPEEVEALRERLALRLHSVPQFKSFCFETFKGDLDSCYIQLFEHEFPGKFDRAIATIRGNWLCVYIWD